MKSLISLILFFTFTTVLAENNCSPDIQKVVKSQSFLEGVLSFKSPNQELLLFSVNLDRSQRANTKGSFTYNKSHKFQDFTKYSFYRPGKNSPVNIVDIYFHGKEGRPAFLLRNVDLFYFLHRRINDRSEKFNCLRKLQGHFAEYRRKSKVFKRKKEDIIQFDGADFNSLAKADKRKFFFDAYPINEFVLTNNCRGIGSFEYEWPGILKGYLQIEPQFLNKVMSAYDGIYNCKEKKLDGFTNQNLGVEARTTPFYAWQLEMSKAKSGVVDYLAMWYSILSQEHYYWFNTGDFSLVQSNSCKIDNIKDLLISEKSKESTLNLTDVKGIIPYEEFSSETRFKSGYERMGEPLSYIKTPCFGDEKKFELPDGFSPPRPRQDESAVAYWSNKPCQLAPYHYVKYEDIFKYRAHLSMFEVDGTYTGQSQEWDSHSAVNRHDYFLLKDTKKRVLFDFDYLNKFKTIKVTESEKHLSFDLKNSDGKNLFIGNVLKNELEKEEKIKNIKGKLLTSKKWSGISSLIGLDPKPLSSLYNETKLEVEKNPLFSYFYDNDGKILDHHKPTVGVEYFYIRKKGCQYLLDLVSHERILPLKRFKFSYQCR